MTTERKHRAELSIEDFGCWLNIFCDIDDYRGRTPEFRAGYEQATRDAYLHFQALGVDWMARWRDGWMNSNRFLPPTAATGDSGAVQDSDSGAVGRGQ